MKWYVSSSVRILISQKISYFLNNSLLVAYIDYGGEKMPNKLIILADFNFSKFLGEPIGKK